MAYSDVIIKADVLAVASELSTLTDAFWVDLLGYINSYTFTCFDDVFTIRMAKIFLAAHMGSRTKRSSTGAAGPVISESAGDVKRVYGYLSSVSSFEDLPSTPYGQTLQAILMASGSHGPFVP